MQKLTVQDRECLERGRLLVLDWQILIDFRHGQYKFSALGLVLICQGVLLVPVTYHCLIHGRNPDALDRLVSAAVSARHFSRPGPQHVSRSALGPADIGYFSEGQCWGSPSPAGTVLRLLAHRQRKTSFTCHSGLLARSCSCSVLWWGFICGGQANTDVQNAHLWASIAIVLLHSGQLLVTAGGSS